MIDFHTHVLPGLDDGCRDIFESQSVLSMFAAQEVTTVIATPHFNARGDTPENFFEARARAYGEVAMATSNLLVPRILLGAEVGYFYGVSRMRELADMRIEGTRLLLLEMPMAPWSESTVRELCELASYSEFKPALAHIERYHRFVPDRVVSKLIEHGVLMQINASFINGKDTRRSALRMIKSGYVHFLGSDCHGASFRPPKIGQAAQIIKAKLGTAFFEREESIFAKSKILGGCPV